MAFRLSNDRDRTGRPSPLACNECRKKHLKCDATLPVCSRCITRGLHCTYTPSRRGIGGRKRLQSPRNLPQPAPTTHAGEYAPQPAAPYAPHHHNHHQPQVSAATGAPAAMRPPPSPNNRAWTDPSDTGRPEAARSPSQPASTTSTSTSKSSLRSEDEHLTNLYYSSFHPSHPILIPRYRYAGQNYPPYLRSVVQFIGSQYAPGISSDCLRPATSAAIAQATDKSPEMVQALLLYAMALHARYEPVDAMPAVTRAVDIAIQLGMHTAEFAIAHGNGDAVYEESLRRTWWELFITDGYLAALHRHTNFKANSVVTSTHLPCESNAYEDGSIPSNPLSIQQYDGRLFGDDDLHFSSFCYRIDAVRILARVIAVSSTNEAHADAIQAIDNALASWKFHLPTDKAGILTHAGETDEMMFQANMFIHISSIFLHFPRSELPITMPPAAEIDCAQQHMEQVSPTSTQHAVKAMAASKDLANLAALPVERHSPFFICTLVFACVVQISACTAYPRDATQQNRDRVALIIGVLKSLSRNWAIAQFVSSQLKRAANEVFNPRDDASAASSGGSTYDSGIDLGNFPSDMSWLELFYNEGMQGQVLTGPADMSGMHHHDARMA
ncbi:related to C6 transcription factor [Lecanosticta acicola]|uniref:Related to C6 transcription factor n=1 Tax=Lecanosticta acicola TaxID=111012 RepID=A0AAI9EAI8_9PEZI|nr:related to C6 transcription factor [Lecanosticta acicola]